MNDEKMQKIIALAIEKAEDAFRKGETPVAAVIFHLETGEVIAEIGRASCRGRV